MIFTVYVDKLFSCRDNHEFVFELTHMLCVKPMTNVALIHISIVFCSKNFSPYPSKVELRMLIMYGAVELLVKIGKRH